MTRPSVAGGLALSACLLAVVSVVAPQGSPEGYPHIYRAQGLPELPGATILSTGRQTRSLRDGLRLRLTSSLALEEVREFYRNALTSQHWKEEDSPATRAAALNPRLSVLTFTKDRTTYSAIITAAPTGGATQISINVLEGALAR